MLYRDAAKAEAYAGMRKALLDVSNEWFAMADRIERLGIVRRINALFH